MLGEFRVNMIVSKIIKSKSLACVSPNAHSSELALERD